jgi:putative component of toxin-antitoxin plasmid stabilization module
MIDWREERHKLKRQIAAEGMAPVLKVLKELLPEGSERYEDVLLIESRQNEANRDRLRNLLSDEELRRVYARIRQDLMDLIDAITDDDFDPDTDEEAVYQGDPPSRGSVLYRIPNRMPMGQATKCTVRISFEEEKLIEGIDLDQHVQIQDIRISEVMQVELLDPTDDPPFTIRPIHSTEQFIDRDTFTEWQFLVTPRRPGTYPLLLKVAVLELIMGRERKREIVLTEEVMIVTEEQSPVTTGDQGGQAMRRATSFVLGGAQTDDSGLDGDAEEVAKKDKGRNWVPIEGADPLSDDRTTRRTSGGTSAPPSPDPSSVPTTTSSKSGSWTYVVRSLTVLLLMGGTAAGYLFAINPAEGAWLTANLLEKDAEAYEQYAQRFPETRHTEDAYRKIAQIRSADDDYLAYLERYPAGEFSREALQTMQRREVLPNDLQLTELTRVSNLKDLAEETRDWQAVKEGVENPRIARDRLDQYVTRHPDSYFQPEVERLKKELQYQNVDPSRLQDVIERPAVPERITLEDRRMRADTAAFMQARKEGSVEAYKQYLEKFPDGVFVAPVKKRLERMQNSTPSDRPTVDAGDFRIDLQEDIQLLEPKTATDLIKILDADLPRSATRQRAMVERYRKALFRVDSLQRVGQMDAATADQQRAAVKKRLENLIREWQ